MILSDFRATVARYTPTLPIVATVADELRDTLARDRSWIVGGSIRRALCGEDAHADIDIYSASAEAMDACANAAMKAGFLYEREVNHNHVLRRGKTVLDFSKRVFEPTADACIARFDYTICQFALFFEGDTLTMLHTPEAVYDLMNGTLMPVAAGCANLDLALRRARKYYRQGFAITPNTLSEFVSITKANADLDPQTHRPRIVGPSPN